MAFAKRIATITPYEGGRFSLRITAQGKFVSATIHPTREAAERLAKTRKAAICD